MLSFDTNVLVYAADRRAGVHHRDAIAILNAGAWVGAALTEQSLIEFLNVSIRKQQQPLNDTAAIVRNWLRMFRLVLPSPSIVEDTISLLSTYPLSVWDARLLAICAANGCDVLLSEDLGDGMHYGPVLVLNPFNPNNATMLGQLLTP